ncbi:tetratricopeptide repeat protein [uncultured Desulfosarcina sp.]|uniref:tetratricopeptide repeat protein n=1 Tax=uncultured Desulfosarcina sp. TaxID=218289 RepID=UPI0029C929D8|nr:tetratricopeptide repeat protein [uncultured Desulfosarcina sp.]
MRTDRATYHLHLEPEWYRVVLVGLLFLVTLLIIYWPSFTGEWHYDDYYNILENKNVQIESLDAKSLRKSLYLGDPEHGGHLSRPLAYFSFAINYYFGKKQVVGYHIVNFAINLSASIFLYLFIQHTLNLPLLRLKFGSVSHPVALLAAFIWAIHPIHVTAVTYIVQRMASLAGLFYIFTLYSYARGRTTESSLGKWAWLAAAALSALLALATKQNSAMIPLSLFFYEWILVQGVGRLSLKKTLAFGFPALATLALIGWFSLNPETFLGSYAKIRPYTPLERVLTQPRVIWQYLSLLFYPTQSRLTLLHDIDFSTSLVSPWTTLPAMISLVLIFIGALFWGARRQPLAAYCIIFFLINHAIEGSFLNLELIYEHRNYLPSMMLFILPAILVVRAIGYFSYAQRLQRGLLSGLALFFSVIGHTTYGYNSIFSNDRLMWADNIAKSPGLSIPYNNYGSRLWEQGLFEKALESYTRAKVQDRYFNLIQKGMVHYNIGLYYSLVANDPETALGYFETALAIAPNNRKIRLEYEKSRGHSGDFIIRIGGSEK